MGTATSLKKMTLEPFYCLFDWDKSGENSEEKALTVVPSIFSFAVDVSDRPPGNHQ